MRRCRVALPPTGRRPGGHREAAFFQARPQAPRAAPRPAYTRRLINISLHAALRCTAVKWWSGAPEMLTRLDCLRALKRSGCTAGGPILAIIFRLKPLFAREAMARRRVFSLRIQSMDACGLCSVYRGRLRRWLGRAVVDVASAFVCSCCRFLVALVGLAKGSGPLLHPGPQLFWPGQSVV